MTISRRGFIAGLALTGAAVPAAFYAHRELTREEFPITPEEATVDLADAAGQQLANSLRGIWSLRLEGRDAGLHGLPLDDLQLFIDIAPRGRGVRGYLDTAGHLRGPDEPRYQVLGDLVPGNAALLYWRLIDRDSPDGMPAYEFKMSLDEVWDSFGNAGSGTLSGQILSLDRPLAALELDNRFVATKQLFPEARERIGLNPALLAWLIAPEHRLFHQLWHASRDQWHKLPEDKRNALRGIGWQPGPRDNERDARGPRKDRNGSGIDFFFMHRHMLGTARSLQDLPSWPRFPQPQPELERDRQGFARYFDNHDGFALPPTWTASGDEQYSQWVSDIKAAETYHSNFQVWESQYRDPRYLAKLTLGQFGSEVELGLHDWLHMRWASVPRDPSNGAPVPFARDPADFAARWYEPENDFLGDPFSSHVNPVFWHFHGWIDDRLEDWFRAHQRFHPGELSRLEVNGVPWFAPGRWVEVGDPWLGPDTHGCSTTPGLQMGRTVEMDPETMKLALRITFGADDDKLQDLFRKVPKRPWYARHLKVKERTI
ncbi:PvdJ/PvdD/PvdP-like protein [Pseudomonas proteolytica]|uniref:PvdJ/PvdD/PvdP-like protein n=1 Tax=Pseudomonas proteolytica TaxID=219574 RepID=A0AAW5A3E9_9PSED|nr:PvdJ/PvdD/PvdP-like protein [Pseudomonas proteolytica]KAA8703855.1 PvdJ/PvdD/PvdP-like protein [Pseudomonas proteolytica]MCF5058118.1 PvdJ/PvdD/PvdP-like protein [Pseudomonas proteolytica]MCF5104960.1 PvdJ/PvdD/PvdP-like protein [Pseudomonas proteolytica]MDF3162462.1 PvdJ/PvdD/PvdP-like protein [Pseudomonas proteolytica]NMZ08069.1 PvdJ/PvdD/PvdP-like protein [Pseudomonas proteolytica]